MAEYVGKKSKNFILIDDVSAAAILLFVGWVLGILTTVYLF